MDSPNHEEAATVRATFTIPGDECDMIEELRLRLGRRAIMFNKSEVVRAGLAALQKLSDDQLVALAQRVPRLKPGKHKKLRSATS